MSAYSHIETNNIILYYKNLDNCICEDAFAEVTVYNQLLGIVVTKTRGSTHATVRCYFRLCLGARSAVIDFPYACILICRAKLAWRIGKS